MKRALVAITLFSALASVAAAHNTPYSWTVPRANAMLPETATVALPPDLQSSLQSELTPLIERLRLLEITAQQDRSNWLAAGTYGNYLKRLREAMERVEGGLPLDSVKCKGLGKVVTKKTKKKVAAKAKRYKHFSCSAASYVLEVPTIEIGTDPDGGLPPILESEVRRYGPYEAVFTLHVTGPSRFVSKRTR
jgi:hypothetical protein